MSHERIFIEKRFWFIAFFAFFLSEKKKRKLRGLLTENCEECPWFETPKIAKTKNAGAKIAGSRCNSSNYKKRWISDQNKNRNKISYNLLLS